MLERNRTRYHSITMKRSLKDQLMRKRSELEDRLEEDESEEGDPVTEAIADALSSNDRIIEIRPAKRSGGMRLKKLLLLGAGALGFAYWSRNSKKPDEVVRGVKDMTANRIHQAAESIEAGSEAASERIEEGSERASEAVQEAGEKAADRAEEAGGKASDKAEETGKKASDKAEEAGEKASEKTEEAGEKASDKTEESGEEVVEEMVEGDEKAADETDGASSSSEA
ncbi:hypothetical protein [Halorubrum sp. CSM-61]|uniref:hypothetical protein n=1 Tax=Halorubrum sp. CSM-61 TaxID=2485838 RepID=UPI000F4BA8EC|nr:hypothetical protein [Halorubrum sp. CSM-61]